MKRLKAVLLGLCILFAVQSVEAGESSEFTLNWMNNNRGMVALIAMGLLGTYGVYASSDMNKKEKEKAVPQGENSRQESQRERERNLPAEAGGVVGKDKGKEEQLKELTDDQKKEALINLIKKAAEFPITIDDLLDENGKSGATAGFKRMIGDTIEFHMYWDENRKPSATVGFKRMYDFLYLFDELKKKQFIEDIISFKEAPLADFIDKIKTSEAFKFCTREALRESGYKSQAGGKASQSSRSSSSASTSKAEITHEPFTQEQKSFIADNQEWYNHLQRILSTGDPAVILDLKDNSSLRQVKKAYTSLSLLFHSDRLGDDKKDIIKQLVQDTDLPFKKINAAYAMLLPLRD